MPAPIFTYTHHTCVHPLASRRTPSAQLARPQKTAHSPCHSPAWKARRPYCRSPSHHNPPRRHRKDSCCVRHNVAFPARHLRSAAKSFAECRHWCPPAAPARRHSLLLISFSPGSAFVLVSSLVSPSVSSHAPCANIYLYTRIQRGGEREGCA